MGEAKRRRDAANKTADYYDIAKGEVATGRAAGDPLEFRRKMIAQATGLLNGTGDGSAAVPCNGCTECCYYHQVPVYPAQETPEHMAHLDLVETDDGLAVRKRDDGACVHLGPGGCTVHEHRAKQ